MVYGRFLVDITMLDGVYKPTYNWGAPHPAGSMLIYQRVNKS